MPDTLPPYDPAPLVKESSARPPTRPRRRGTGRAREVAFGLLAAVTVALALTGYYYNFDPYLRYLWEMPRELGLLPSFLAVLALVCAPRLPSVALALLWVSLLSVALFALPPQAALLTSVVVGFACAGWGSRWTLWLSGLSIPLATLVVVFVADWRVLSRIADSVGFTSFSYSLYNSLDWRILVFLLPQVALWIPWLAGLAWRFRNRSQEAVEQTAVAEAQRDQAAEVALVREEQAQLARDVHDVVGHSLTVILAQAQAAQYLQDDEKVRTSLDTIAATAMTSLEEVRRVLSATAGEVPTAPATEELHSMLEGVRASGRRVDFIEEGQRRPLPPELATVAHRVLQEMVTNAVRYGDEAAPIEVERHWGWDLRLEVSNVVRSFDETQPIALAPATGADATELRHSPSASAGGAHSVPSGGQGIIGMRRRLESVGGRLDVRLRGPRPGVAQAAPTHTVTAWIPLPGTSEVRRG